MHQFFRANIILSFSVLTGAVFWRLLSEGRALDLDWTREAMIAAFAFTVYAFLIWVLAQKAHQRTERFLGAFALYGLAVQSTLHFAPEGHAEPFLTMILYMGLMAALIGWFIPGKDASDREDASRADA